ncbi:transposase domain-containing protein [Streptomyces sp. NPDC001070]
MASSPEIVAPEVPWPRHSATPPPVASALDVYAPGHLGELTQVIDPQLVDAVLEDTGSRERRVRLLPARVVMYFVLALAFFERSSCRAVWDKLGTGLHGIAVARPCASSLSRARRRLGSAPRRHLFEILAGPVAVRAQSGSFLPRSAGGRGGRHHLEHPRRGRGDLALPQARRSGARIRLPPAAPGGAARVRHPRPARRRLRPHLHEQARRLGGISGGCLGCAVEGTPSARRSRGATRASEVLAQTLLIDGRRDPVPEVTRRCPGCATRPSPTSWCPSPRTPPPGPLPGRVGARRFALRWKGS